MARLLTILLVLLAGAGLWFLLRGAPTPASTSGGLDLLRRRPDALIEQPGSLEPHPRRRFGDANLLGWEQVAPVDPADALTSGGVAFVPATQPRTVLQLDAVDAQTRTVRLLLFARPFAGDLGEVTVKFNGQWKPEWTFALSPTPEVVEVVVEELLWNAGANQLELSVEPEADAGGRTGWDTLCLGGVTWDERRIEVQVDPYERLLALSPGAGARYVVTAAADAELVLRGKSDGPGELELLLGSLELLGGTERAGDDLPRLPVDGAFERRLTLPPAGPGELRTVGFAWHATDEDVFLFEELAVVETDAAPRPHVVFVSIDTLAARHLSVYGYERDTTPRMRALAEEGVVFERAIANAPWTLPSYLSVMTGLYPRAHLRSDVQRRPGDELLGFENWQIAPNRWTLAEALRSRGYQTAGFVDTAWLLDEFRFAQGFDLYDKSPVNQPFQDPAGGIVLIDEHVGQWLGEIDPTEPAFLFVHALDAHGPYWPDSPWKGSFTASWDHAGLPTVPASGAFQSYQMMPDWMSKTIVDRDGVERTGPIADALLAENAENPPRQVPVAPVVDAYDEAIAKVDEYVGRILDRLAAAGMYDDAVVVISADHGESFAHDFFGHGRMFEDIVHVPLLVKLPQGAHAGTRVATSVQLVDVYPTLLELAGAAVQDGLHGRSLADALGGAALAPYPTFSEGGHCTQFMVEEDGWKLVQSFPAETPSAASILTDPRLPREWIEERMPGYAPLLEFPFTEQDWAKLRTHEGYADLVAAARREIVGPYFELYDLNTDPDELVNVAERHPERVERLLALVEERTAEATEARELARPVQAASLGGASLEQLKELGYVGGDQ